MRLIYRDKDGARHAYWALMKSVRTARGPRSHVVAYLGALPEAERRGVADAAEGCGSVQDGLFEERAAWVEVDASRVRVERVREFGVAWLAHELLRQTGTDAFFAGMLPAGREDIPWALMAQVLVVSRLCDASSELRIAEHFYRHSAMEDILGIPADKINDDRLYRALDEVLPHKEALELHLKERLGALFRVNVETRSDGGAHVTWQEVEQWRAWSELSEGCYLLRSNVDDWSAEDLWRTYIQLTEAEAAFRIHKSDLRIRPIWHQKPQRAQAHILVCFLAYVLWKTLAQRCRQAGLGDEPRKVIAELQQIHLVDVVLPTKSGIEIRKRCVTQPSQHQAILLQRLGFQLPQRPDIHKM